MSNFLKYPILFERATDDTNTLGLGYMTGILTGTVTRDRNAIPVLEMTYLEDNYLSKEIKNGRIILCDGGNRFLQQKFRITKVERDVDASGVHTLLIDASHIINDLNYNVITEDISYANIDAKGAFDAVNKALADPIPALDFDTDILKVANVAWHHKEVDNVIDILLGADAEGEQTNSFEAIYNGEFDFDNYTIHYKQSAGIDTGIVIKYGRNLVTMQQDNEIEDTFNAVRPFATYTPPEAKEDDTDNSQYIKDFTGVGVVQWVGAGGCTLYDMPFKGHKVLDKVLKNGDYYKIFHTADENTVNSDTWYDLGGNQWIDGHFFTLDKDGAYSYNAVSGQGTIGYNLDNPESKQTIVDYPGVASINYLGPKAVTIWSSPFSDKKPTGKYMANGGFWKVFRKATDGNGHEWYDLGDNQWIDVTYITFEKNGDYAVVACRGICQIKKDENGYNTPVYDRPGSGKVKTKKYLYPGQKYQIFSKAEYNGETWYNVGSGEWISSATCDFSVPGTQEPQEPTDTNEESAQVSGKVPVWDGPGVGHKKTGKILTSGQQYKILGQADSSGSTWYKVGANEWIDGTFMTFDKPTDVTPQGAVADTTEDENTTDTTEDITITLPEKIIKADKADNYERLRITNFDASEYNIDTEDKLRQVTEAYIKDYRIGYPTVALTVTYQEMTGQLKDLTTVDLYDYATVFFEYINVAEKSECTEVVWDMVAKRPESVTFGEKPITLTHLLKKFETDIDSKVSSTGKAISDTEMGLHDEIHAAVTKTGADMDAAVLDLQQKLEMQAGVNEKDNATTLQTLKDALVKYDQNIQDISDWISSGSSGGVITAYPDWKEPTELRAASDSGGYMKFNSHGLGYYSDSGLVRSAIDSEGRIAAENISGVLGSFIKIDSVDIEGESYIYLSSGDQHTELSWMNGMSTSQDIAADGNGRVGGDFTVGGKFTSNGETYIEPSGIYIMGVGNARIYYDTDQHSFGIFDGQHGNFLIEPK
ncbi:phage tail spike protein [Lactobacillus acetotolerans]|uniref:phage tail spike protein n=1 Tax=Lactobacillus acetotolerans TaxID=1600 RepID=UPI002FDAC87A